MTTIKSKPKPDAAARIAAKTFPYATCGPARRKELATRIRREIRKAKRAAWNAYGDMEYADKQGQKDEATRIYFKFWSKP